MGEEDCPAVVDELVKVDLSMGSESLEVGGYLYVSELFTSDHGFSIPVDPSRRRGCS